MSFRGFLRSFKGKPVAGPATLPPAEVYPSVSVFEWRPESGSINFGDHLSSVIVQKILADRHLSFHEETKESRQLLAIGSVIHFAKSGDVVWGSGINGKIEDKRRYSKGLDVRAVRGPLTAKRLREYGNRAPDIFGDPALLLPKVFPGRFVPAATTDVVFVPNLHDLSILETDLPVISPLWGWNRVVNEIMKARMVLASSLHGIIVAEAFGIPARYVRLSENEPLFKYDDYAKGTGRSGINAATSIHEALDRGGLDAPQFDADKLLSAFPWDLWQ